MKRLLLCALMLAISVAYGQEQNANELVSLPRIAASPKDNPTTPAKIALGKMLFFDPRLSGDNRISYHNPSFEPGILKFSSVPQ